MLFLGPLRKHHAGGSHVDEYQMSVRISSEVFFLIIRRNKCKLTFAMRLYLTQDLATSDRCQLGISASPWAKKKKKAAE